ncbi:hypothetical protein PCURB6_41700 [Paenibacillus curdlanolyticus]|nr:serine hydrolase [Paenibacillus curdlanolyticus]GFN33910.1 hypothetical protein PCURB6_41700 [Paenibacillus curdlanolyticus]
MNRILEISLFLPLGMSHSEFNPNLINDVDIAQEYGYLFGFSTKVAPYWKTFGSSQAAEGGAYSNVLDLSQIMIAVLGHHADSFIASDKFDQHTKNGVVASDLDGAIYTESGFEQSEVYGTRILSKSGEGMGSSSEMVIIPDKQIGFVMLVGESNGERRSRITEGVVSILLDQEPKSVAGVINVFQVLGYISLGIIAVSLFFMLVLIRSVVRKYRNQFQLKYRWLNLIRLLLLIIVLLPILYLLFVFRPTEAGFYGYPYDLAAAIIVAAVCVFIWIVYSAFLLFIPRNWK